MKGLLVLLLCGLLPGPLALAQLSQLPQLNDAGATQDGPRVFTLVLTDALIEKLKTDPDGLNSEIPKDIQGRVVGVKLTYQRPPLNSSRPTNRKPPVSNGFGSGNEQIASNPPALDNRSFSGLAPIEPTRNAQSNLYDNPMGNYPFAGPQLPPGRLPATANGNSNNPQWANPNMDIQPPPTNNSTLPNIGSTARQTNQVPPGRTAGNTGFESQLDLLKREADDLEAKRLAWENSKKEQQRIDALVAQQVRIEKERWIQQQRAAQQSNLENNNLLTASRYGLPEFQSSVPTNRVDHRTGLNGDPSYRVADNTRLNNYGQPVAAGNDRSRSDGALAPRPTGGSSLPPSLMVPPPTKVVTTTPEEANTSLAAKPKSRSTEKTNFALLLFLIASGALNLFLGVIARGFYVRYNDLADELRETFSATV